MVSIILSLLLKKKPFINEFNQILIKQMVKKFSLYIQMS